MMYMTHVHTAFTTSMRFALVISKVFIDHLNIFFSPGGQSNFPKKIEFYSGFTYFKCVLQLLDLAIVPSIRICNDF